MKSIVSTKKKIIIIVAFTCIATAIVALIEIIKPQLYTVHSSFIIQNAPTYPTLDLNRVVINAINDNEIADSVSSANGITIEDYKKHVAASIDENKNIVMAVSAETPETAAQISEQIVELLNVKIKDVVVEQTLAEATKINKELKTIEYLVDSLKYVVGKVDSITSTKVSKAGTRKDQLIEQKILLENDPDYIFISKLMEKFAYDYGTKLINCREKTNIVALENDFIKIINKANSKNAVSINKTKRIAAAAFIAFICSICLVVFWNTIVSSRNKKQNDEK